MTWERVYTVNDCYGGLLLGVADFHGKPHIYKAESTEVADDYTGRFWLAEIDPDLLLSEM
jgi:hypothetical protein